YAYFNQIICTYFNYSIVENRSMEYCLQEKGKGCERPKLDPFSAEVMALTRDMPKVTCDGFDWIVCKCGLANKCFVIPIITISHPCELLFIRITSECGCSYNIVGDGTPAALLPILTGKSEEEHPDARKKITKKVYVDHRSFIFHKLKSFGYGVVLF
ncbi:hypothetical protein HF086_011262, partial [Spodoptera exigua]